MMQAHGLQRIHVSYVCMLQLLTFNPRVAVLSASQYPHYLLPHYRNSYNNTITRTLYIFNHTLKRNTLKFAYLSCCCLLDTHLSESPTRSTEF